MGRVGVYTSLAVLLLLRGVCQAQTGCGLEHTGPGAFLCYPNPAENAADAKVPEVFHLSAQGNAPEGGLIARYSVEMDGRRIYDTRLATPQQQLSIETNLKSPFLSGVHTLRVVIEGAGSAQASGISFYRPNNVGFCEPFTRLEARSCLTANSREPLDWSAAAPPAGLASFKDLLQIYSRNLKSLEADVFDAAAIDPQGNLYVALHWNADIELRKYSRDGGQVYDNLIRGCGRGTVAVTALTLDGQGRVWLGGNATACIATTSGAIVPRVEESPEPRGFVILVDPQKPSSAPPVYATYLSTVPSRVHAVRSGGEGTVYVVGAAGSLEFPHESVVSTGENPRATETAFVAALQISTPALLWSTLLKGAQLNGVAVDQSNNVYVTGRTVRDAQGEVLVAGLSDRGRRLSYLAHLGGAGAGEGRAIAMTPDGKWILIAGATQSADFLKKSPAQTEPAGEAQPFAMALQPCATGAVYAQRFADRDMEDSPEIAISPALDAFAALFAGGGAMEGQSRPSGSVKSGARCPSSATP